MVAVTGSLSVPQGFLHNELQCKTVVNPPINPCSHVPPEFLCPIAGMGSMEDSKQRPRMRCDFGPREHGDMLELCQPVRCSDIRVSLDARPGADAAAMSI